MLQAADFEQHSDFNNYYLLRSFDQAANVAHALVPDLDFYAAMIERNILLTESINDKTYALSDKQLHFYESHGYLKVSNFVFDGSISSIIQQWVEEINNGLPREEVCNCIVHIVNCVYFLTL